jgi:hypothetical protein
MNIELEIRLDTFFTLDSYRLNIKKSNIGITSLGDQLWYVDNNNKLVFAIILRSGCTVAFQQFLYLTGF